MTKNDNNIDIAVLKTKVKALDTTMKGGFKRIVQDNKEQADDIKETISNHVETIMKAVESKADKEQTRTELAATRQDYNKVLMMIISLFLAGIVSFIYQIIRP